ncbi:MAG: shikimate kinase [Nitrospirota bacterium]
MGQVRNVVLVGFMGTGKSAIGGRLAKAVSFRFFDTDHLIEERAGKKITDLFSEFGETRFREIEMEVIRDVMRGEHLVVSTGGGAVIRKENRDFFSQNGTVVYLSARHDIILSRAQRRPGQRPLLQGGDPGATIKRLMQERAPLYQDVADFSLDTSDMSIEAAVFKIKEMVFRGAMDASQG